jgi:hypothetical protein
LHNYHDQSQKFPPGAVIFLGTSSAGSGDGTLSPSDSGGYDMLWRAENGDRCQSWMVLILPFVEQAALYNNWNFGADVNSNKLTAAGAPLASANLNRFLNGVAVTTTMGDASVPVIWQLTRLMLLVTALCISVQLPPQRGELERITAEFSTETVIPV